MSETEVRKIRKLYTGIAMGVLGLVAAYIIFSAVVLKSTGPLYQIVVIAGIALFWVIMDICIPVRTKEFADKTPEQISAYKKYAAMDLVGYGGLVFFALAVGQETGIYGALVYVVARVMKRRFQEEYEGVSEEDEDAEDAQEAAKDVLTGEEAQIAGAGSEGDAEAQEEPAAYIDADEDDEVKAWD